MSKFTVFYTDDDEDDLSLFEYAVSTLEGNPIELITYDRGDKLLSAIENPPPSPNLIFLDLNMPGKNGFEVLREIRNSERYKGIPVVIFSTSSEIDTIQRCKTLGANYFITKPISLKEIINSIEHALTIKWDAFMPTLNEFVYKG